MSVRSEPVAALFVVLTSFYRFLYYLSLRLWGHFSRLKLKTSHFYSSSSVLPSQIYGLEGVSDLEIWQILFSLWSQLPDNIIFLCLYALTLVASFQGYRLKYITSVVSCQYKQTFGSKAASDLKVWWLVFFFALKLAVISVFVLNDLRCNF